MDDKLLVDFDPDTYGALARRAELHGHAVDEEVRSIVKGAVSSTILETDWVERARAIRAMTPPGSIRVDSWKLIRASRDWDH